MFLNLHPKGVNTPIINLPFPAGINLWLMISRTILNRMIILGFMALVGFCLARSIYYGSVMGVILAITSLGAAVYFLYLVAKANQRMETVETEETA